MNQNPGTAALCGCFLLTAATLLQGQTNSGVGLSLFFQNGTMPPTTLYGNANRYLQELDITSKTAASPVDVGIEPLKLLPDMASLNWNGVHLVEEEWKPSAAGKFTRVRYYRGALWMQRSSTFTITPVDANGTATGTAITADAGWDDRIRESTDDAWVRRFTARQTATGCPAKNDCTGASYTAQAVISFRDAMLPQNRARAVATNAASLELRWSESNFIYRLAINHAPVPASYGYGLQPSLELVNGPVGGRTYFLAGETVQLRIVLKDNAGHRLHPSGSLPTYAQVSSGADPSGIRYYNPNLNPQLYYAFKHREANGLVTISGPTDRMTTSKLSVTNSFAPQVITASVPTDGFSALVVGYPPLSVTRNGGPADTPVSDIVSFTLPFDALPGTYVAALKARREFGGEALNKGAMIRLQVGGVNVTGASPKIGGCQDCHEGRSAFPNVLHGLPDTTPCAACHTSATFIGAYDQRVHTIHDRSNRFDENINECSTCHRQIPSGQANGIVIHTQSNSQPKP